MKVAAAAFAVCCLVWAAPAAQAHGAFPIPLGVHVGPKGYGDLIITTNFGYFRVSPGEAARFYCEPEAAANVDRYLLSVNPALRVHGLGNTVHASTQADTCHWAAATIPGEYVRFARTDAEGQLVYLLARGVDDPDTDALLLAPTEEAASASVVWRWSAREFDLGTVLSSSATGIHYLAGGSAETYEPILLRSVDHGRNWQTLSPKIEIGAGAFILVDLEPQDPLRLFLRAADATGDRLMRSFDGGETLEPVLDIPEQVMKVVHLEDGRLIILVRRDHERGLYIGPWSGPFEHRSVPFALRDLAAKGDHFYGLLESTEFGIDLVTSEDGGESWEEQQYVGFDASIDPCGGSACAQSCTILSDFGLISAASCARFGNAPRDDAGPAEPEPRPDRDSSAGKRASCNSSGARTSVSSSLLLCIGLALTGLSRRRTRRRQWPSRN